MNSYKKSGRLFWIVFASLIVFNIWHLTLIRIWSPATIMQSLHIGENVAKEFKTFDPRLEVSDVSYDSQYTYAILYDPILRHCNHLHIFDNAQYRYTRILFPWLAYVLARGQYRYFPIAMFGISLGSYFLGGVFVALLAKNQKWTPWVVLGYFSISGLAYTAFWNLTEPLALCLIIIALYLWTMNRRILGMFFLSLAIMAREVSIIVALTIYIYELYSKRIMVSQALFEVTGIALPLIIWKGYLSFRIPSLSFYPSWGPHVPGYNRFTLPFSAMWIEGKFAWSHLTTHTEYKRTFGILFLTLPLILWSVITFTYRPKTFWSFLAISQALFLTIIRGDLWDYSAGSMRMVITFYLFVIFWCADEIKSSKRKNHIATPDVISNSKNC